MKKLLIRIYCFIAGHYWSDGLVSTMDGRIVIRRRCRRCDTTRYVKSLLEVRGDGVRSISTTRYGV